MRIFLIRHGESAGNANHEIYNTVPDNKIELTDLGIGQARKVGVKLREEFDVKVPVIYSSTHKRAMQTAENLAESANFIHSKAHYEPRIIEQEWRGHLNEPFDDKHHWLRTQFGSFHYRFDTGESGLDVYCRVKPFLREILLDNKHTDDIIIVSHGITINIMIMALLNELPEFAESIKYPKNCGCILIEGGKNSLELKSELVYRKNKKK